MVEGPFGTSGGVTKTSVPTFFVKAWSLCTTGSKGPWLRCLLARASRFPKICLRVAQGMYLSIYMYLLIEICMYVCMYVCTYVPMYVKGGSK